MDMIAEQGWIKPANPALRFYATAVICIGALFTALTLPTGIAELEIYRYCAYAMGITIAVAIWVEAIGGIRSLIRVDIVAICTLYFLTFAEFLHPHVRLLYEAETGAAGYACTLALIGFAGIAVGRLISLPVRYAPSRVALPELSPRTMLWLFFGMAFLGYLYVLITTYGNPYTIVTALLQPRFDRPWQRGQEGGWLSFLTELQLLLYVVAAIGGLILAQRGQFSFRIRLGVGAMLLFMLLFDFSEGTRNVVLIKVGVFLVTFFMASRQTHSFRLILLCVVGAASLWVVSGYMLDFRSEGLGNYLSRDETSVASQNDGFMVDNNMVAIARATGVFPTIYPYPGSEVVVQIFTKWIPRALWPGKPLNWTVSLEDALATGGGYTLALTYIGEAYLISGIPSLIIVSILIGMIASWWTRVGLLARTNMDLIYYASGFFAATLAMRSIQFVTIAIVPTVALYLVGRMLRRKRPARPQLTYR